MTKEERAIQILEKRKCCMECVVSNFTCAECDEAFEMAIKALEQEQNCSEIPTGSTTKTCRTCRNFGSHHGICDICKKYSCWTEKEPTTKNDSPKYCDRNICLKNEYNNVGCEDCEVTKSQEPTTKNDCADDKTFYEQIVEYCNEHFLVLVEKDVWKDAEKALTTKNDLGVKFISKSDVDRIIDCPYFRQADKLIQIMNLPPVTPQEPKIGHWVLGGYDDYYYICDKCNYKASEYYFKPRYNFCPNCGAKMVEPQESEDEKC